MAKPAKKDLPASKVITGGKKNGGKLAGNDNLTLVRGDVNHFTRIGLENTMASTKDLPAKTDVKGGGRKLFNDNLTLVRAAKPAKKDLPAGKDVKGGKKRND